MQRSTNWKQCICQTHNAKEIIHYILVPPQHTANQAFCILVQKHLRQFISQKSLHLLLVKWILHYNNLSFQAALSARTFSGNLSIDMTCRSVASFTAAPVKTALDTHLTGGPMGPRTDMEMVVYSTTPFLPRIKLTISLLTELSHLTLKGMLFINYLNGP